MDINGFSEELMERIKVLNKEDIQHKDLIQTGKTLTELKSILAQLKPFLSKYTFKASEEEIHFFKETKPVILSHYYFYKRIFSIKLFDTFYDREARICHYRQHMKAMEMYVNKNMKFFKYCISGNNDLDNHYFKKGNTNLSSINIDASFSTGFDNKLGKLLGNEMAREYISAQISLLNQTTQTHSLTWSASKVSLVELIYALHSINAFNNGTTDVKQIVTFFEQSFSIDLGNYARTFSEIRLRKSGQTNFLDQVRERFLNLINQLE